MDYSKKLFDFMKDGHLFDGWARIANNLIFLP